MPGGWSGLLDLDQFDEEETYEIEDVLDIEGMEPLLEAIYIAEGGEEASVPYGATGFERQGRSFMQPKNQETFQTLIEELDLDIEEPDEDLYEAAAATTINWYWDQFREQQNLPEESDIIDLDETQQTEFVEFLGARYAPTEGDLTEAEEELNKFWVGNVKQAMELDDITVEEPAPDWRDLIQLEPEEKETDLTVDIAAGFLERNPDKSPREISQMIADDEELSTTLSTEIGVPVHEIISTLENLENRGISTTEEIEKNLGITVDTDLTERAPAIFGTVKDDKGFIGPDFIQSPVEAMMRAGYTVQESSVILGIADNMFRSAVGTETREEAQRRIDPQTGTWIDPAIDFAGGIAGMLTDFYTLGKLVGPIIGKLPTPDITQPGLQFAGKRLARTGLRQATGEEISSLDYVRSGVSGFLAGEAGHLAGLGIKHMGATQRISETVYPALERGISGAAVGATFTGVDLAFNNIFNTEEDVTLGDLGANMLTMALLYSAPLAVSSKARDKVNQARVDLAHKKAEGPYALRKIGLSEQATKEDIHNKWEELKTKTTQGELQGITEAEKVHYLSDIAGARDTAVDAIDRMTLPQNMKTNIKTKLDQLKTGISRRFTGTTSTDLVPVEQQIRTEPIVSTEAFIQDVREGAIDPAELTGGKLNYDKIENLLSEPELATDITDPGKGVTPELQPDEPVKITADETDDADLEEIKTNIIKEKTEIIDGLQERATDKGVDINLDEYDIPTAEDDVNVVGRKFIQAISDIKSDINTKEQAMIQEEMETEAQQRISELEAKDSPGFIDDIEYNLDMIRAGEISTDNVLNKIRVLDTEAKNRYGDVSLRSSIIDQVVEKSSAPKDTILVEHEHGTMELKNDPEVLGWLMYHLGAKDDTRTLKGPAPSEDEIKKSVTSGEDNDIEEEGLTEKHREALKQLAKLQKDKEREEGKAVSEEIMADKVANRPANSPDLIAKKEWPDTFDRSEYEEEVEFVSRLEIDEYIFNEILPISKGRLRSWKAEGEYDPLEKTIKVRRASDLMTKAHELGHHLVRDLGITSVDQMPDEAADEVIRLFKKSDLDEDGYSPDQWWDEGNSEFWKIYLLDSKKAEQLAPNYYKFIENKVQDSEIEEQIRQLQEYYYRWGRMPAEEQLRASIAKGEMEIESIYSPLDTFMTKMWDDKNPIKKPRDMMLEKAGEEPVRYIDMLRDNPDATLEDAREKGLTMLDDPYRQIRQLPAMEHPLLNSLVNEAQMSPDREPVGPPLKKILEPVTDYLGTREKAGDFDVWMIAKHGIERAKKGKSIGMEKEQLETIVDRLERPLFKEVAQQIQGYHSTILDWLEYGEVIDAETKANIDEAYEWYLPLNRLFSHEGYISKGGNRLVDVGSPIMEAYGSDRIIKSPLESIIHNTSIAINKALSNRVAANLYRLTQETGGMGNLIETIATPTEVQEIALKDIKGDLQEAGVPDDIIEDMDLDHIAKTYKARFFTNEIDQKENVHMIRIEGQAVPVKINDPQLERALTNYQDSWNPESMAAKIATAPTKGIKIGAVLAPFYGAKNPIRDQATSMFFSDCTFVPVLETLKGAKGLITGDGDELRWRAAGGSRGALTADITSFMAADDPDIHDIIEGKEETKAIKNIINLFWRGATSYRKLFLGSEESTRFGHFKHTLQQFDMEGKSELEKRLIYDELAEESRQGINLDYLKKGEIVRTADHFSAFAGATLNNVFKVFEKLKNNPIKTGLAGLAVHTLPNLLLWYRNKDDPMYQEDPLWKKIAFKNIYRGDPEDPIEERPTPIRLPIAFFDEILFGKVAELMMDARYQEKPHETSDIATELLRGSIGIGEPDILTPFIATWRNEKPFTQIPVIPYEQEGIYPTEQYGPHTYEIPKALANIFDKVPGSPDLLRSPRQLQLFMRSWGGTLGQNFMSLGDFVTGKKNTIETASEIFPIVRDAYMSPVSVNRVYQDRDKYLEIVNTIDYQIEQGRVTPEQLMRGDANLKFTAEEYREAQQALNPDSPREVGIEGVTSAMTDIRKQMADARLEYERGHITREQFQQIEQDLNIAIINLARRYYNLEPVPTGN